jgi:hypothetical protein
MLPPQIKPMLGQSVMTVSIWKVFVLDGSFAKQLISLTTLPSLQVHPVWQVCWVHRPFVPWTVQVSPGAQGTTAAIAVPR